jgi:toxin CcdB
MAQFDIHENAGPNRDTIPFVVVVQSALFDDFRRRVVVPLVKKSAVGKVDRVRFNPEFRIRGTAVLLHPLEVASVPVDRLGKVVGSLADDGQRVIDALDELLTRAWS